MADIRWKLSGRAVNPLTILATELNSLVASTGAVLSPVVPNASDLDLYVDFELVVTFAANPVADNVVELWIVRAVDTVNYEDGSTATIVPRNGFAGNFVVRAVSSVQRMVIPRVVVPPRDFKVLIVNKTTQAFTASGHTLKGDFYRGQV